MSGWNSWNGACKQARERSTRPNRRALRERARASLWLALLSLVLLAGCSRQPDVTGETLRVSQRNEPATLDPALATLPDEFFILRGLLEGLLAPSPDGGEPVPAAAERWTVSADGRTYTFHLRPDRRWSNGEPVTASDFLASYRRALTPATAAPKADLFFIVEGAEAFYRGDLADFAATGFSAPNPHTLVVRLVRPAPQFLACVASGPWLPVNPGVVERHGAQWTRPENFVGNGAFTLAEWRPHQRLLLRRRTGEPVASEVHVETLAFLAMDNGDTEERAFRAGQLDVTMAVPASKLAGYENTVDPRLVRTPLHESRYLTFNTQRGPLKDARVRRALCLAIDREALVQNVVLGGQRAATSFVPPGLGGYAPPESPIRFAPEEARRLLAEAGFPNGSGFPRLELATWTNLAVAEAIQAMWKDALGIEVGIMQREARVHIAALAAGDYDLGFMTAIPDIADAADLLGNLRSGAPANYPRWSVPAYDNALRHADDAVDAGERHRRLAAAEHLLLEARAVSPLYFNTRNYLVAPLVEGWREDALWNRYYSGVRVRSEAR